MINNGSFENNATNAENWSMVTANGATGSMMLEDTNLFNSAQTRCLQLTVEKLPAGGRVGVENNGYWGINVARGTVYQLTFFARCAAGTASLPASLEDAQHQQVYAVTTVTSLTPNWRRFTVKLRASGTDHDGRLALCPTAIGTVWLDVVTLFPEETVGSSYESIFISNNHCNLIFISHASPTPAGRHVFVAANRSR